MIANMNSIRRPKRLRHLSTIRVVSVALGVVIVGFLAFSTFVSADGGWGPGGNGNTGACDVKGIFCSTHGTRWESYDVTAGSGPNCGFRDDNKSDANPDWSHHASPAHGCPDMPSSLESYKWTTIMSTCGVGGKVYVFELNDGYGNAMGYNYNSDNGAAPTSQTKNGPDAYAAWKAAVKAGITSGSATWGPDGGNIGWFCYAKAAPPTTFKITPKVIISKTTAKPGDKITWTHTATNTGTGSTGSTKINYGWNPVNSSTGTVGAPTHIDASALGVGKTESGTSTYTIKASDVDKTICRDTYADPKATGDSGAVYSGKACVTVPYSYSLTPTITSLTPTNMTAAGNVLATVTGTIKNSGATVSETASWLYTRFVVGIGQSLPGIQGKNNDTNPCHLLAGYSGCITMPGATGSGSRTFSANSTTGESTSETLGAYPLGSQICYVLSVAPPSKGSNQRYYSNVRCVIVAKFPLVQVSGGDLVVGRDGMGDYDPNASIIVSPPSSSGGSTYGSWSEFAAMAPGASNIATAGALATSANRSTVLSTNTLTFANYPAGNYGHFGPTGSATDLYGAYPAAPGGYVSTSISVNTTLDLSSLTGKHYYTVSSGTPLRVSGTVAPGVSIIIHAAGNVEIIGTGITYALGPYTKPADLPQVLIASNKNILIDPTVTNVDAWLYAKGTAAANGVIDTCYTGSVHANSSYTAGLSAAPGNPCNSAPLAVNGPVSTAHLQLRRTAGADGASDASQSVSGESFNLRPDAFLWLAAQNGTSGPTTVYTQEVAPRY